MCSSNTLLFSLALRGQSMLLRRLLRVKVDMSYSISSLSPPTYRRIWNVWFHARWLVHPSRSRSWLPHNFWSSYGYLIRYHNEIFSCSFKWSYRPPPIVLTIEPRMVSILWARSPISLKHMMPFWYPFLHPHPLLHSQQSVANIEILKNMKVCGWNRHCALAPQNVESRSRREPISGDHGSW